VRGQVIDEHAAHRRIVVDHENADRFHSPQVYKPETNCFGIEIAAIPPLSTLASIATHSERSVT
jgi:hypothetical protein